MANPGEPQKHSNAFLAGFEDRRGRWHPVEFQDRAPDPRTLGRSPRVVIGIEYLDSDGEPTGEVDYATTDALTKDHTIDDAIDELDASKYGALSGE